MRAAESTERGERAARILEAADELLGEIGYDGPAWGASPTAPA